MLTLITAAISLATALCGFVQTEVLLECPKQLADLQNQLNTELAKGQDSDDAKIESLYAQIAVIIGQINNQVAIMQASKGTTTTTPPASS